jgi:hypothetical protein
MNNLLPKALREAQERKIEFFMGEDCEWKLESKGPAKFIEEIVGCPVCVFANNGFGDYLFLKRKPHGSRYEEEVFEFFHEGPEIMAIRFRNGQICPLVDPESGKLKKVRFVERARVDDK